MIKNTNNKLIVILGPTASGKTKLSISLAKRFSGEIINADSRIFYKELNIGTDKPIKTKNKKQKAKEYIVNGVPHHLIDILKPNQKFSIAEYQKLAKEKIKEIQNRKRIPFLVGGSPLYLESVIYNYEIPKIPPDFKFRKKLEKKSLKNLVSKLLKLDPDTEGAVDLKNKRRVIRALEILSKVSKGPSLANLAKKLPKNILLLGLKTERETLYQKINKRVSEMLKKGLEKEVKRVVKKYGSDAPALSGIGYRQIVKYLKGEITKEEAIELVKRDSRRFAKRQFTWFKRDRNIKWISTPKEAVSKIKIFLKFTK